MQTFNGSSVQSRGQGIEWRRHLLFRTSPSDRNWHCIVSDRRKSLTYCKKLATGNSTF
jgi:hypothetical protein